MASNTSSADLVVSSGQWAVVGVSSTILITTVVVNILALFVFIRVKSLRRSSVHIMVMNMCVADLLGAGLWLSVIPVTAYTGTWKLGNVYCKLHGVLSTLVLAVNMHTLSYVGLDRFTLAWLPHRHALIFRPTTSTILLSATWLFDINISIFPLLGWSEMQFSPHQFQCTINYMKDMSNWYFTFILTYALPFMLTSIVFLLTFSKMCRKLTSTTSVEKATLLPAALKKHHGNLAEGLSTDYFLTLLMVENKIKRATIEGHVNIDSDDECEGVQDYVHVTHVYSQDKDLKPTLAFGIAFLVYSILWMPALLLDFFLGIFWSEPPNDTIAEVLAITSFVAFSVKPFIYLTNFQYRKALAKACMRKNPVTQ